MSDWATTIWTFWTAPVRAERLAVFRIAVGTLVAFDAAASFAPHAVDYFGATGLFPARLFEVSQGGGRWSLLSANATPGEVHVALGALLLSAGGVAVGLGTRISCIVMWALLVSLHQRSPYVMNGGDFLLQVAALYLMLMPAGARWSLDHARRRRRGEDGDPWVPPWAFRLAQVQLALVYLFTGLSKLPVPGGPGVGNWISGEAIAKALGTASMGRFEFLTTIPWWVYAPLTWLTLGWELLFPVLVCFRRTRKIALLYGVAFHLGIFATLEIGAFSFAALCYYLLYLPAGWFGPETPTVASGGKVGV